MQITPIVALRKFFGQKPGQTLGEFAAEVKALSEDEKMELATLAAKELNATLKTEDQK